MAEYIEREAAYTLAKKIVDAVHSGEYSSIQLPHFILDAIDDIHAANVQPVRRGHWITEEEAEAKGNYSLRDACSVCGHCDWDNTESKYFNFCPNCGAMMEES